MKRCPQCNRVETDETLKFCRTDGTALIASAALESEVMEAMHANGDVFAN